MNLKVAATALILMGFMDGKAVERNTVKYSEVVNQLIEAATLDDAKMILKDYDAHDQDILRDRLLDRQKLWFTEHGLYDAVVLRNSAANSAIYIIGGVFGLVGAVGLRVSFDILSFEYQYGYKYGYNCKEVLTGTSLGLVGTMCGLLAIAIIMSEPPINKHICEFQRIKQLLACVG